jgi:ATP-dependent RNA helicase RhlE
MEFKELNLNKFLWNALDDLEFTEATLIQERAFPVIMSGKDVIGIAQTGTGKTYAYLLPLLRMHTFAKHRFPQVLILVPTRELVVQVVDEVEKLSSYMTLQCKGIYGGVNIRTQAAEIIKGVDIIVATPGRLMDLALNGSLNLKYISKVVIDEMDEMLNLGFRTQITNIIDMLPERRQNLLFSATIIPEVEDFINQFFNNPERIEAARTGTPLVNIHQMAYKVPNFNTKLNLLKHLFVENEAFSKVLIFTASKKMADELYAYVYDQFEEKVGVIHSNKAQNNRFKTVEDFHSGAIRILIATDIVARGLDISIVSHVFNFDIPEIPENYIHRIGRTGRADKNGVSISFVAPYEENSLKKIEYIMDKSVEIIEMPEEVKISTVLTEAEMPVVPMKNVLVKVATLVERGPAFHEKIDKNKKVNKKVRHVDKMKAKYGKPKTRGQKGKKS